MRIHAERLNTEEWMFHDNEVWRIMFHPEVEMMLVEVFDRDDDWILWDFQVLGAAKVFDSLPDYCKPAEAMQ